MNKSENFEKLLEEMNVKMQSLLYKNGDTHLATLRIRHSFRTADIAVKLWEEYNKKWHIDEGDKLILIIGCMMHDCAKYIDDTSHDELGFIITRSIMKKAQEKYKDLNISDRDIGLLDFTMSRHSDKKEPLALNGFTIYKALLIDADIIEKFNVYHNSGDSLEEIYNNMESYYMRKKRYIKTPEGLKMFDEIMENIKPILNNKELENKDLSELHNMITVDFDNPSNRNIDEN